MFGAYAIGTHPYGSIVTETGLAVLDIEIAEATATTNLITPTIFIEMGLADSTAESVNAFIGQGLNLGRAEASISANDLTQKILPDLGFAVAIASATTPVPQIRFKIGRAEASAQALDMVSQHNLDLGLGVATASSNDFGGVGIGTLLAEATASSNDILPQVFLDLGLPEAVASAISPELFIKLQASVATANTTVNDIVINQLINVSPAEAIAEALSLTDIVYVVDDVPVIQVDRTSAQAVVKTTNPSDLYNVRIFRAEDHRGTFSQLVANHDESSDYTDSGLDATKNYKYKCAFIVVGTKGGVQYIAVGERSAPVYTIGTNVL